MLDIDTRFGGHLRCAGLLGGAGGTGAEIGGTEYDTIICYLHWVKGYHT